MFKLKVLMVADECCAAEPQTAAVQEILESQGYDYQLFVDLNWKDLKDKQLGFERLVEELPEDYTHIMFLDARDVVVLAPAEQVMEKWFRLNHPWVYAAEACPWPPGTPEPPSPDTLYFRYLNSGTCIGEREYILKAQRAWRASGLSFEGYINDQDWVADRYYEGYPDLIHLDHQNEVFTCWIGSNHNLDLSPGFAHNGVTNTDPPIIHFNGGVNILEARYRILWESLV